MPPQWARRDPFWLRFLLRKTVQEFKVQTSLYDPAFGRAGGGNIQMVTRSGSNSPRGAVYEYFRNEVLNANNPFLKAADISRPVLKRQVFGATFGGPIRKYPTFFFLSYQGTRERNGASPLNSVSSGVCGEGLPRASDATETLGLEPRIASPKWSGHARESERCRDRVVQLRVRAQAVKCSGE